MRSVIAVVLFIVLAWGAAARADMETNAKFAMMVDYDTGAALLSKNADEPMPPSSMSKLMTAYALYSRIKAGRVKLDDSFLVSEKAWRMQGSKMFVHVGDSVKVEDLIRGIVIQSGNDACIVVAEGLSGSEEAFAQELNRIGKEIGLNSSHFVNSTGWPDEGHLMTARDLATLARRIISDFPEHYHFYSEREFTYSGITQPNRNRLLASTIGVDGLKTGHTEVAGYGITLSAKDPKSGRRLILVINGLESDNARVEEGDKLLRYGFREFENRTLVKAGMAVDTLPVWYGEKESVTLVPEKDMVVTLPHKAEGIRFVLEAASPVKAPVAKGTKLADLKISLPDRNEPMVVPLVAAEDVPEASIFLRMLMNIKHIAGAR